MLNGCISLAECSIATNLDTVGHSI